MPNDTSPARPACQGIDPELFFGHFSNIAAGICADCPVREQCARNTLAAEFEFAITHTGDEDHDQPYRGGAIEAYGYAGGMTARQRTGILTRRGRAYHAQLASA